MWPLLDMSMFLACTSVRMPRHFIVTLVFANELSNNDGQQAEKHNLMYHQSKSLECKHPHREEEKAGVDLLFARQL